MKNIDDGPIYNGSIRINRREDIKEEKLSKQEKEIIESKKNLPEGQEDFNKKYKELENMQVDINNFNAESETLLQQNREAINNIYKKYLEKKEKNLSDFNDEIKAILDEFDEKRKEIEKTFKENDIEKYTEKIKKLYNEMQNKWVKNKLNYEEKESQIKELEQKEIKKYNKEYNNKLENLRKKYSFN